MDYGRRGRAVLASCFPFRPSNLSAHSTVRLRNKVQESFFGETRSNGCSIRSGKMAGCLWRLND